jgi:four helix bundle protein
LKNENFPGHCSFVISEFSWLACYAGRNHKRGKSMNDHMADQIEDRLIDFSVRVIRLTGGLPATYAAEHIARQMLRAGTSPAANYGEARGAESRADFVHKLRIALKELNETKVWLKMLGRAHLAAETAVAPVLDECQQLARILNASIRTSRRPAD